MTSVKYMQIISSHIFCHKKKINMSGWANI